MKKHITLTALLISLLAVGAYAQAEGDPVKEQTQEQAQLQTQEQTQLQTRENGQILDGDKDGGQNQQMNYGGGEGETHELGDKPRHGGDFAGEGGPNGPLDSDDKILDGDKSGGQNQEMNYGGGEGETHELGEKPRYGGDFAGEGGPNGPLDSGDKVLDGEGDGECDGEQTQARTRNYGEGEGNNQELGEMHRYGDENEGEGPHGPHGTEGSGPIDDFLKISGENADGTFAGEMLQYGWGPGDCSLDGPFGPNDGTGHGPGGRDAADGDDPAKGARSQARGGRR